MSIAAATLPNEPFINEPFTNKPFINKPFINKAHSHYAAVLPGRLAHTAPTTQVYIRRRLLVLAVLVAVVVVVWLGAGSVRATRGGEPAAPSTGRPAVTDSAYMVQPGDTLWSIAAHHHGAADQADYVDALIQRNGGTIVQVGQVLALP